MNLRGKMPFHDLREFISFLEKRNLLVRIKAEVDPKLEVTEILNRLLAKKGQPLYSRM